MAPLPERKFTPEEKEGMIKRWVDNVPEELKKLNFWMNHDRTKSPFDERGFPLSHRAEKNHRSFDDVINTFRNDATNKIYGIGFVLRKGVNNLVCLDFDRIRNPETGAFVKQYDRGTEPGEPEIRMEHLVDDIFGYESSYTEYSPSGRGIHALIFGERKDDAPKNLYTNKTKPDGSPNGQYDNLKEIEIFDDSFITVTGNVYKDHNKIISSDFIHEGLRKLYFGKINLNKKYGYHDTEVLDAGEEFFAPCFKAIIGMSSPAHISRVSLVTYLIALGRKDNEILNYFKKFSNFNEDKSLKGITAIRKGEYACPSCKTITQYGFCQYDECPHIKYAKHPLWVTKINKIADFVTIGQKGGMVFNQEKIAEHIIKKYSVVAFGSEKTATWNGYMYDVNDASNKIKDEIIRIVEEVKYTGSVLDLTKGIHARICHKARLPDYPFGKIPYRIYTRNQTLVINPENYGITIKNHEPADLNDYVFKRDYVPANDTVKAQEWLNQFGKENADRIVTMIGTVIATKAMNNNHSFKSLFLLIGPKDAGKTVLAEKVIRNEIFGGDACSHLSLEEVVDERFGLDVMVGKAANIHDDLPARFVEKASKLKGFTGSSTKSVEKKNENKYSYSQWPVYIFTSNNYPVFKNSDLETDAAFWERWRIIKFNTVFTPDMKIIDYNNDEILDGIFKLAVEKSIEILKSNKIVGFDDTLITEMRRRSDKFELFFEENIQVSVGNYISTAELWNTYKRFCDEYNLEKRERLQPQILKDKMTDKKYPEMILYDRDEYHERSGYKNIKIKDSPKPRCWGEKSKPQEIVTEKKIGSRTVTIDQVEIEI